MTASALAAVPEPADTTALAEETSTLVLAAEAIVIADEQSYIAACEFGKRIKASINDVVAFFAPRKKRWHEGHAAECADEKSFLEPRARAEKIIKDKVLAWKIEESKREEEGRRLREEQALKLAEERQLQEALDVEAEGDLAAADEILAAPIAVPIVPAAPPATKVAGVSTQKRWTFDQSRVNLDAVIKHIAGIPQDQPLAHPELRRLVQLDTTATRQLVTAMRDQFNVPGIPAGQVEGVAFGK